jgi:hypothetical protein
MNVPLALMGVTSNAMTLWDHLSAAVSLISACNQMGGIALVRAIFL